MAKINLVVQRLGTFPPALPPAQATNGAIISYEARGEAVRLAAAQGNARVVTELLANRATISDEARGEAVRLAATYGRADIVTQLLANEATIPDQARGVAVRLAATYGHASVVTQLLANGATISDQARGEAVLLAAMPGHAETVTQLLANGATISDQARGQAVLLAAMNGHAEIVTQLLANGATISDQDRGEAVRSAARNGHAGIVALLGGMPAASLFPAAPQALTGARIYVMPQQFAEHPELYLANIAAAGLKPVTFMNPDGSQQPGIDAGGLTKQFICQLAEHLLLQKVIEREDRRFPCARKQETTPYTQLGQLLSHIDQANATRTDSLYIGEIFPPETYTLLQMLARPQDPSEPLETRNERECIAIANAIFSLTKPEEKPNYQELMDFLNIKDPSPEAIQAFKEYLESTLEDVKEDITPAELREICFQKMEVQQCHRAMSAIIEGLSTALKGKILREGAAMASKIQGTIDNRLLDKFTLTSANPVVIQKLAWIKEKITSELADPEKIWIKRFLKAVTSQAVMPAGSLKISDSSDTMCHAHTCFSKLDLPIGGTSKEVFFERLELLMAEVGFGST
ncbi:MAG: ankyrin repeat domain-containing protein [Chlamydiae bacterium]|nr:ankyrin repeat domain-containing protein [Chlamydiota bacterium]